MSLKPTAYCWQARQSNQVTVMAGSENEFDVVDSAFVPEFGPFESIASQTRGGRNDRARGDRSQRDATRRDRSHRLGLIRFDCYAMDSDFDRCPPA